MWTITDIINWFQSVNTGYWLIVLGILLITIYASYKHGKVQPIFFGLVTSVILICFSYSIEPALMGFWLYDNLFYAYTSLIFCIIWLIFIIQILVNCIENGTVIQ